MLWGRNQIDEFQKTVVAGYANVVLGFNELVSFLRQRMFRNKFIFISDPIKLDSPTCLLRMLLACGNNTFNPSSPKATNLSLLQSLLTLTRSNG